MSPEFWPGRRVLVTGHTGFKGSWLCLLLHRLGAEVSGYALPPHTDPSLFEQAAVGDAVNSTFADVLDAAQLEAALQRERPEIVIHMAAQSLVPRGYADPIGTYAVNVMGTAHVLEAARHAPSVRAVVSVTSDKCYANQELARGYREGDPLGGDDPYSSSKGAAELVTAAYRSSYFRDGPVAVASARAGNVLGGGDWSEARLVPDIVRAAFGSGELRLRYPNAVRPWQHVLDPLNGYLLLAERLTTGSQTWARAWNFGPAQVDVRPVGDVVDRLVQLLAVPVVVIADDAPANRESVTLMLDATAARDALGWTPLVDLDTTLAWIAEWHRGHADGRSARALCDADIERFLDRAAR